jgi:hypothetical protein
VDHSLCKSAWSHSNFDFPLVERNCSWLRLAGIRTVFGSPREDWKSGNGFRFRTFSSPSCHTIVVDFVPPTVEKQKSTATEFCSIFQFPREMPLLGFFTFPVPYYQHQLQLCCCLPTIEKQKSATSEKTAISHSARKAINIGAVTDCSNNSCNCSKKFSDLYPQRYFDTDFLPFSALTDVRKSLRFLQVSTFPLSLFISKIPVFLCEKGQEMKRHPFPPLIP